MREAGSDQPLSVVPPEARLVRAPAAVHSVTVLPDGAVTVAQKHAKNGPRKERGRVSRKVLVVDPIQRSSCQSRGPDCVKKAGT